MINQILNITHFGAYSFSFKCTESELNLSPLILLICIASTKVLNKDLMVRLFGFKRIGKDR